MSKILKFRKLTLSIVIILIIAGAYSYRIIPKQENPTLSVPVSIVTITAPGMDSNEIDENVIISMRSDISSVEGLDYIESYSYDNYAIMIVAGELGLDDPMTLNEAVYKTIDTQDYPDNVEISIENDLESAAILYTFPADQINESKRFEQELYDLGNIKKVEISDYKSNYFQVKIDNNLIAQYGISLNDIANIIEANGIETTLGYIESSSVITTNNYSSIEALQSLPIYSNNGSIIYLSDISIIEEKTEKDYISTLNNEDVLYLSVYFDSKIDITTMSDKIRDLSKDYPEFTEVSFSPDDVADAISGINQNLIIGMILVLIVVLIGLGIRSAISILITFPLTIFTTLLILNLLGLDLQKVSIAGLIISIGIIVDNAIVVIDAINYNLEIGNNMNDSIKKSIKKNSLPVLTSTLTTIVAFTPLLFLPGVGGQMAFTLPLTVIIALIVSYLCSIFVIPIIASKFIVVRSKTTNKNLKPLILFFIKRPIRVIIVVFILLIGTVSALILTQPIELFPTAEKEYIYIDYTSGNSNDLDAMKDISSIIVSNIDSDYILNSINYTIPSFYNTLQENLKSPNSGRVLYKFSGNNTKEIKRLESVLSKELDSSVSFVVEELMLNDSGAPIVINLFDIDKSSEIISDLEEIDGVESIQTTSLDTRNGYKLEFNENLLVEQNLTKAEVSLEVATLLNGTTVDVIKADEIDNNLSIVATISTLDEILTQNVVIRNNVYSLKDLVILTPFDKEIAVYRYDFKKYQNIDIFIKDNASVYTVQKNVVDVLDRYDVKYEIKGEVSLTSEMFTSVMYAALAAILIIFIILLIQFNKFKNVLIILSSIPIAIVGSATLLLIFDIPITFTVTLGLVSLMGMVVNNGILLLDYIENSTEFTVLEKCLESVLRRSRAIIISNITTIIGLIPLVIWGDSFFRPMAICLVGGLLVAVPLSLICVPSLYIILHKRNVKIQVN